MNAPLKAVKGGKTDETPDVRHVTLRGVRYTIREIDVTEYDKIIESLADENGNVRFDKLMRALVVACVTPQSSKPLKFPVYRTLEGIVNEMHYTDVKDESKPDEDSDDAEAEEEEGKEAPNS